MVLLSLSGFEAAYDCKIEHCQPDQERLPIQLRPEATDFLIKVEHTTNRLGKTRLEHPLLPKLNPQIEQERELLHSLILIHVQISKRLGLFLSILPLHLHTNDMFHLEFISLTII